MEKYKDVWRPEKEYELMWKYRKVDEGVWNCLWRNIKEYEGVCSYGKGMEGYVEILTVNIRELELPVYHLILVTCTCGLVLARVFGKTAATTSESSKWLPFLPL